MIPKIVLWHRLFGLTLSDYFTHSHFSVELEKDLSVKQQLLDIVVVRREPGAIGEPVSDAAEPLPDGLENFSDHNLITYKSQRETLNDWAIEELCSHAVIYRKLVSPRGRLLPRQQFRKYAISTRFPNRLAREVELKPVQPGV